MNATFTTYCLGVGCMTKCDTCQHAKNWRILNQMPNALRLARQRQMKRMSENQCQLTSGHLYEPEDEPPAAEESGS